jgi:hypothetical protein
MTVVITKEDRKHAPMSIQVNLWPLLIARGIDPRKPYVVREVDAGLEFEQAGDAAA